MKCRSNAVDITLSQRLSKVFELKLSGRDLLAESIDFKQFPTFTNGKRRRRAPRTGHKELQPGALVFPYCRSDLLIAQAFILTALIQHTDKEHAIVNQRYYP